MEGITLRDSTKQDCQEIRRLIQELADYEKMPDGPRIDAKVLEEDGFGPNPFYKCLVAEDNNNPGQLIGYALFFYVYSTWEGKSVYMEDLYVTPKYRGKGIGMSLWRNVVKIGLQLGCSRCSFSVLDWNKPSIEFYQRFGAVNLTEKEGWLSFRMSKEVMEEFVKPKQ